MSVIIECNCQGFFKEGSHHEMGVLLPDWICKTMMWSQTQRPGHDPRVSQRRRFKVNRKLSEFLLNVTFMTAIHFKDNPNHNKIQNKTKPATRWQQSCRHSHG